MADAETVVSKQCAACGESKPLSEFRRRTGRRSGEQSRRGRCKSCSKKQRAAVPAAKPSTGPDSDDPSGFKEEPKRSKQPPRPEQPSHPAKPPRAAELTRPAKPPLRPAKPPRNRQPESAGHAVADPADPSLLVPTRQGFIRMRGRTDKGRRWFQEIDLELAVTLVKERAAVVVNRHTIRRLFSNKAFRRYILTRDKHTCHFCGQYGDTIDHLLPRAKGGHTTPDNCVCACNTCNQSKGDRDLEEFVGARAGG
ncbi:HNH endonuclease [Cohnella sp. CFH 77786]|uniref:HNH endonuclease n=1 Tax=Cohnella sp. CFH 77786 TaxID=2662265 RepID=UPI001C60939A|nr:HNH endonuclease [Cohnella sp. CFH 77786]MBW5446021.1 HNH endonuclease [Cohnella sp. CFH 77786]